MRVGSSGAVVLSPGSAGVDDSAALRPSAPVAPGSLGGTAPSESPVQRQKHPAVPGDPSAPVCHSIRTFDLSLEAFPIESIGTRHRSSSFERLSPSGHEKGVVVCTLSEEGSLSPVPASVSVARFDRTDVFCTCSAAEDWFADENSKPTRLVSSQPLILSIIDSGNLCTLYGL